MKKIIKNNRCLMVGLLMLSALSYDAMGMDFWTNDPWADPYGLIEDQYQEGYRANRHYYPEQSIGQYIRDAKYLQTQEIDINNLNNPNPHAKDYWIARYAPLYKAIDNKDVELIKVLVRAGANVNIQIYNNRTPLDFAITSFSRDIGQINPEPFLKKRLIVIQTLIDAGADVNALSGMGNRVTTPLLAAEDQGSTGIMKMLIRAGADGGLADGRGRTPLDMAVDRKCFDIVQAIMDSNHPILDVALPLRDQLENDPTFKPRLQGADRNRMIEILGSIVWEDAK